MTYFQNEIWDTGGDGRISITGDIYSQADPFSIYINATPFEVIEFATAQTEIKNDLNVLGTISINGVPISGTAVTTEDLVPGIFGNNEAPGTFSFESGLNIDGTLGLVGNLNVDGFLDVVDNGYYFHSTDNAQYAELTFDFVGSNTNVIQSLFSNSTGLSFEVYDDSIVPASSVCLLTSSVNFELSANGSINLAPGAELKISNAIVPSLGFISTTSAINFSIDWYDGSVQKVVIDASVTISFSNPIAGRTYVLIIEQGTGGSRVPTLTGFNFGDNPPTWSIAFGAKDVVSAVYDGTEYLAAFAVQNA